MTGPWIAIASLMTAVPVDAVRRAATADARQARVRPASVVTRIVRRVVIARADRAVKATAGHAWVVLVGMAVVTTAVNVKNAANHRRRCPK